jgi:hypothetical protein
MVQREATDSREGETRRDLPARPEQEVAANWQTAKLTAHLIAAQRFRGPFFFVCGDAISAVYTLISLSPLPFALTAVVLPKTLSSVPAHCTGPNTVPVTPFPGEPDNIRISALRSVCTRPPTPPAPPALHMSACSWLPDAVQSPPPLAPVGSAFLSPVARRSYLGPGCLERSGPVDI